MRHGPRETIRFRALLISAGYPGANDSDALRSDPAFKMAVGRQPEAALDPCLQPTMCRLENLPARTTWIRMMDAMVVLFCARFEDVPRCIRLDIDETLDRQQLSLLHVHHDRRCFLPIRIDEATAGRPMAVIPWPGKTSDGQEVVLALRHTVRAIRAHWRRVEIVVRGESHHARHEAMGGCLCQARRRYGAENAWRLAV